jgi:hypothetical protein
VTAPTQQAPPPDVTAGQVAVYALEVAATAKAVQMAIRAALLRDVVKLWPALDKSRLSETFPGWLRAMSLLITNYRDQSSFAAGRSYQAMRAQALQSPTPARLIKMAPAPEQEWLNRALGFSGPGTLDKETARPGTALSTTLGTAARIALDGGRTTTLDTVKADPAAVGWWRMTDGDPCFWCAMLASRGVTYKEHSFARSDARFDGEGDAKVHNSCGCTLKPAFSQTQRLPQVNDEAEHVWRESTAGLSSDQARAAFRKAWATHQQQRSRTA